jgi:hypothetical protein
MAVHGSALMPGGAAVCKKNVLTVLLSSGCKPENEFADGTPKSRCDSRLDGWCLTAMKFDGRQRACSDKPSVVTRQYAIGQLLMDARTYKEAQGRA